MSFLRRCLETKLDEESQQLVHELLYLLINLLGNLIDKIAEGYISPIYNIVQSSKDMAFDVKIKYYMYLASSAVTRQGDTDSRNIRASNIIIAFLNSEIYPEISRNQCSSYDPHVFLCCVHLVVYETVLHQSNKILDTISSISQSQQGRCRQELFNFVQSHMLLYSLMDKLSE